MHKYLLLCAPCLCAYRVNVPLDSLQMIFVVCCSANLNGALISPPTYTVCKIPDFPEIKHSKANNRNSSIASVLCVLMQPPTHNIHLYSVITKWKWGAVHAMPFYSICKRNMVPFLLHVALYVNEKWCFPSDTHTFP